LHLQKQVGLDRSWEITIGPVLIPVVAMVGGRDLIPGLLLDGTRRRILCNGPGIRSIVIVA